MKIKKLLSWHSIYCHPFLITSPARKKVKWHHFVIFIILRYSIYHIQTLQAVCHHKWHCLVGGMAILPFPRFAQSDWIFWGKHWTKQDQNCGFETLEMVNFPVNEPWLTCPKLDLYINALTDNSLLSLGLQPPLVCHNALTSWCKAQIENWWLILEDHNILSATVNRETDKIKHQPITVCPVM